MQPNFLVTGANGFFGSNIVDQLLEQGHKVHGVIRTHNQWSENTKNPNLSFSIGDITELSNLDEIFSKNTNENTIVIHTAGLVSIASHIEPQLKKVNVEGTANVIEVCEKHHVKRLVYVSSVHAIPELPNHGTMTEVDDFSPDLVVGGYAKTKAMASQLAVEARYSELDVVIVHPAGMIGPGDWGNGNVKQALVDYANRKLTAITRGGYNFADVRDVARSTITASLLDKAKNQNYILSGQYVRIHDIIKMMDRSHPKYKHHLTVIPNWFIKITAPLAELWYKMRKVPPTFTRYSVYTLTSNANFSYQKASRELGYSPRPIEQTVSDAVSWYEKAGFIKPR